MNTIKTYISMALFFVSLATLAQTTIVKDGNYTVTGSESLTASQSITLKPNSWIRQGSTFSAVVSPDVYQDISLNGNQNYVFTRAFQAPITETTLESSGISNNSDVIESIAYYDGLGRPKQQIGIKASPDKNDIITHISYDDYGRQTKQFLPFEHQTNVKGAYKPVNVVTDINKYYQNKYPTDFEGMAEADVNAYSEYVFERSTFNRVLEVAAPGKSWRVNMSNNHTIKSKWETNRAEDVVYFWVDFHQGNTQVPMLVKERYYAPQELYVTITKDENWQPGQSNENDHTTREYKDKLGRVVLKRAFASTSSATAEAHDTYYVYDDFGNLTYVIPPKVIITDGISDNELAELCYQYIYDKRNRLVEKKIPGKGWEYIVYNILDQPVLTQDANQRNKHPQEWIYTKYDAFGRLAYSGLYLELDDDQSRLDLQNDANDIDQHDAFEKRQQGPGTIQEVPIWYNNGSYPKALERLYTINYYDDYVFDKVGLTLPSATTFGIDIINYNDATATRHKTRGLVTGTKVQVLDTDDWITTLMGYDDKGRVIYIISKNEYLNTVDVVESKLDFVGKVLETKTTHTKGRNAAIVTTDSFTYDHMGRLLDQTQTINNQTEEHLVSNTYDELGQLESKEVGGGLQDVDYTYNVRGWLTDINNDSNTDQDLFDFSIKYDDITDVSKKLFNGNISQTSWSTASDNATNNPVSSSYTYSYDALNRISSAIDNTGNYNLTSVAYDKNGNITSLVRNGHTNSIANSFGVMDNLTYVYNENGIGNQLYSVTDTNASTEGFTDGNTTGNDYLYDENGNMIRDKNKAISSITYNHLNLPTSVSFSDNSGVRPVFIGSINYRYDAVGNKLTKRVSYNTGAGNTTSYAGSFVYEKNMVPGCAGCPQPDEELKFFNHPEGYIEPENDGTFSYIYQYKDHLGNIRLSYSDKDNDGHIDVLRNNSDVDGDGDNAHEIREEKNYYPFGLEHKGYNNVVSSNSNSVARKFKYNGKELEKALGYNMYEYEARHYDASLARFVTIDPLAEDYSFQSSYAYAVNSPIRFIDKLGMAPMDVILRGANGSSVTLETDLVDLDIDASSLGVDFGGNYSFAGEDILVAGLDIAGVFDPTGAADIAAGSIEMKNGNIWSGLASYAGVVPLVGDVAKVGKIGKHVKTINKAIDGVKSQKKIAKAKRGKGSVPKAQRDPKRAFSKKQKKEMQERQNGECPNCGDKKPIDQMDGHHVKRHADGGSTTTDNGVNLCTDCHKKVHSKND